MRETRPRPLRITQLRLTNWRNFRSADITLDLRAFFVGPNASGKSNLLDAVRFLAEIARPGSGGLQAAIEHRGGFSSLRCLQARTISHVGIEVQVGTDERPDRWHYALRMNVQKKEKRPTVIEETIRQNGTEITRRIRAPGDDPPEYSQTLIEQVVTNKSFRELTDFLGSCRYLHVVPQIVRDRSRAIRDGEDPYGGDLLRRIKDMPKKTREPRLRRISQALALAVPQFSELELQDDADRVPHLYASYAHWRRYATRQSEADFSDGTLRLIGLLWSISERGGPLLLEEPELSLNDAVVSELPRMFARMQKLSGRQILTTTHSTSLLDDQGVGLREVHYIAVDSNGSRVENLAANRQVAAQVNAGMTIGEAVLPLVRPKDIERLSQLDVVG